jgi:hypothetical protein
MIVVLKVQWLFYYIYKSVEQRLPDLCDDCIYKIDNNDDDNRINKIRMQNQIGTETRAIYTLAHHMCVYLPPGSSLPVKAPEEACFLCAIEFSEVTQRLFLPQLSAHWALFLCILFNENCTFLIGLCTALSICYLFCLTCSFAWSLDSWGS